MTEWQKQWDDTISSALPIKDSNEKIWNFFKQREITPAAGGLYQFDGEVEIENSCKGIMCEDMDDWKEENCSQCKKVALIKDTEVKQESKEDVYYYVFDYINNTPDETSIDEILFYLKQHFKIEKNE